MSPLHETAAPLLQRACYSYYGDNCYRSGWSWWGRWLFLGLIVAFVFLLLLLVCVRNRRRRSRGLPPAYGTGWTGNWGHQQQQQQNYPPPPPQYTQQPPVGAQYTGTTYNSNQGYYANTGTYGDGYNNGIPLQQPANAYTRTTADDYAPPTGPPPAKK